MRTMNGLFCAVAVTALVGCPPPGTGPGTGTPHGPGSLTMRADWPNNCSTCSTVTFPNHCWTGAWASGTSTSGGSTSIARMCQTRAEIIGSPNPISVSTTALGLKPGSWTVQLAVEGVPTANCPATVPEASFGTVWVDTAGCHKFP
jgi:hypothetical protein